MRRWLSILEQSYLIFFIKPYHKNLNKRPAKSSKLYFYDTGLLCYLLGILQEKQLDIHYRLGAIYENVVMLEFLKKHLHRGVFTQLYFWRDRISSIEIDCIIEQNNIVHAIEIKSGKTFRTDLISNVMYFVKHLQSPAQGYLVYNAKESRMVNGIKLVSFQDLIALKFERFDDEYDDEY